MKDRITLCFSDYFYKRNLHQSLDTLRARALRKWKNGYGEALVYLTADEFARIRIEV